MTLNAKKQLILHIGDPKTGTSSIQRAFETQSVDFGDLKPQETQSIFRWMCISQQKRNRHWIA